jgi:hypothetical protein
MAVSKFAIACVAAILAGGATAGLARSDDRTATPVQVLDEHPVTPIAAITDPQATLQDVAVRFVSGKQFGRVVAVATDAHGHAARIRVALDGMPTKLWIDQSDLVYSRSQDAIVAHDVHPPALTVASR